MATDIVPELNEKIQLAFRKRLMRNRKLPAINRMIREGTATLEEAHAYSAIVGEAASDALRSVLTVENLPYGTLWRNIAERTVTPLLEDCYGLVNDQAEMIQQIVDRAAKIKLGSVRADFPQDRIDDLVNKMTETYDFEEAVKWLGEPIVNNAEAFFDDYVDRNAQFRNQSGLDARIQRTAEAGACRWCADLAGSWRYGSQPDDVYARHEFCRCSVTYTSGRRAQSVWSKRSWELSEEQIERMKSARGPDTTPREIREENLARAEAEREAARQRREALKRR